MRSVTHFLEVLLLGTRPCNACSLRSAFSDGFCQSCHDAVRAFIARRKQFTHTTSKQPDKIDTAA
jgi:hypothetical protein